MYPASLRYYKVKLKSERKPTIVVGHGYEVKETGYLRVWQRFMGDAVVDVFNVYPGSWEWIRDEGECEG